MKDWVPDKDILGSPLRFEDLRMRGLRIERLGPRQRHAGISATLRGADWHRFWVKNFQLVFGDGFGYC